VSVKLRDISHDLQKHTGDREPIKSHDLAITGFRANLENLKVRENLEKSGSFFENLYKLGKIREKYFMIVKNVLCYYDTKFFISKFLLRLLFIFALFLLF